MFKSKGKNSLSELFLYLDYVKSFKNIDHSKTFNFINYINSKNIKELINTANNHKNEWISHVVNDELLFDFMLTENSVTFKTKHWFKTVEFK